MVLDEGSPSVASILCACEAHTDWLIHLDQFPSPDIARIITKEDLPSRVLATAKFGTQCECS
jgi:hypothetical protein